MVVPKIGHSSCLGTRQAVPNFERLISGETTMKKFKMQLVATTALAIFSLMPPALAEQEPARWLAPSEGAKDYFNVSQLARHQWFSRSILARIQFAKSFELDQDSSFENRVGLTNGGTLYQVSQIKSEKAKNGFIWIGRILSGDLKIRDFAFTPAGVLVASTDDNGLYIFDNEKWHRSPIPSHWRSGLKSWALTMAGMALSASVVFTQTDQDPEILYLIGPLAALGAAAFHVIREYARFDDDNLAPSGLEKVPEFKIEGQRPLAEELNAINFSVESSEIKWTPPCEQVLVKLPPEAYIDRRRL